MISVVNSTMAITTLILLLTTGILAASAECQKDNAPIESCCSLGFNNTTFSKKRPGVYTMMNFVEHSVMMLKFIATLAAEEEDG